MAREASLGDACGHGGGVAWERRLVGVGRGSGLEREGVGEGNGGGDGGEVVGEEGGGGGAGGAVDGAVAVAWPLRLFRERA